MIPIPNTPEKIRRRIRSYERRLRDEKKKFGEYSDGAGKRYLLGPLYLLMDDVKGALESYDWFEKAFPDDGGEPGHCLCWALTLFRAGRTDAAKRKLGEAMLENLYLIPHLIGQDRDPIEMWHGSNWGEAEFVHHIPPEYFRAWDPVAIEWAQELYKSDEFQKCEQREIEINKELMDLRPGERRTALVRESGQLRKKWRQEGGE